MNKSEVGRIRNISLDEDKDELVVSIVITDKKFKKKLLRDLSLSGNIEFVNDKILFTGNKKE